MNFGSIDKMSDRQYNSKKHFTDVDWMLKKAERRNKVLQKYAAGKE